MPTTYCINTCGKDSKQMAAKQSPVPAFHQKCMTETDKMEKLSVDVKKLLNNTTITMNMRNETMITN